MKLYICGDSFCVPDPEYGTMWVDILHDQLPQVEIVNLAKVSASNMHISLQVDKALSVNPNAIICHFTSSTRRSYRVRASAAPLIEQFEKGDLVSYSIPTCTTLQPVLEKKHIDAIREYYFQYCDLDAEIYVNKCVIESVLWRLAHSDTSWKYDQGGFEHSSFGRNISYFQRFQSHRIPYNLWDYANSRSYRPFYHIPDVKTHSKIADYYVKWIKEILQ